MRGGRDRNRARLGLGAALVGATTVVVLFAQGGGERGITSAQGSAKLTASIRALASKTISRADSVHFLNAKVGWVETDNDSRLLLTADGGRSWTNISPQMLGASKQVIGSFMLSRDDLWVTVANAHRETASSVEAFNSTDGGKTWTNRGSFPSDYGDAWPYFQSRSRGWMLVDNGAGMAADSVTIYATTSGGKHWSRIARSANPTKWGATPGAPSRVCDKTGISFASPSSGWIGVACNGPLTTQRSTDGGRIWHVVTPGDVGRSAGDADAPQFFTSSDGVMTAEVDSSGGNHDVIFTTTGGGTRWRAHDMPVKTAGAMSVASQRTWFVFKDKRLYRTRNGGKSWTSTRSSVIPKPSGTGFTDFEFVNASDGWAITQRSQLWRTSDGGRTWQRS